MHYIDEVMEKKCSIHEASQVDFVSLVWVSLRVTPLATLKLILAHSKTLNKNTPDVTEIANGKRLGILEVYVNIKNNVTNILLNDPFRFEVFIILIQ